MRGQRLPAADGLSDVEFEGSAGALNQTRDETVGVVTTELAWKIVVVRTVAIIPLTLAQSAIGFSLSVKGEALSAPSFLPSLYWICCMKKWLHAQALLLKFWGRDLNMDRLSPDERALWRKRPSIAARASTLRSDRLLRLRRRLRCACARLLSNVDRCIRQYCALQRDPNG